MTQVPPPPPPPPSAPLPGPVDPRSAVSGPAIGLLVTGALGILYQVIALLINVLGAGMGALGGRNGMLNMLSGGVGVVLNIIAILVGGFVIFGAMKMKNLQAYNLALGASVIAMIPCISPCCLLGLPIGIWALVMLLKPEVKAAFGQGTPGSPVS